VRVLVVNAGSTSVKLRMVEPDHSVSHRLDLGPPAGQADPGLARFLGSVGEVDAVGHRVVHGGPDFTGPVIVDGEVRRALDATLELAPLHNPPALHALDQVRRAIPGPPVVACFDTAFHRTLPAEAREYALPAEWVQRWGIRRYGFHGLSCEWALIRSARLLGRPREDLKLVVCHLGGGASVTAIAHGRSMDTTMGFTPTEGLVMASRSGDVDPGALAWLVGRGLAADELTQGLEKRSGLLGLTGGRTGDMQVLLQDRSGGDPVAAGAVAVYLHRLRAKIAGAAAGAGGIDALVFTGGVGEHSAAIRAEACDGLTWMGVAIDPAGNAAAGSTDTDIAAPAAAVRVLVIPAREELVVADQCRRLLALS
jgi:acetate kinase